MPIQSPHLRPIYTIDARDRLAEVNDAFIASVQGLIDGAGGQAFIGRSIWEFVDGAVPRRIWRILFERVRAVSAPIFVPLRADTASERCIIDLELHPMGDRSIRHVRECVSREARPAVALLDANYPRDSRTLIRCAWCARIQVRLGSWQAIEDAQATLRLEATATLPMLHDSACPACTQSVLKTFPARVA